MLEQDELNLGFFMKKYLSKQDIEELKSNGYIECSRKSILTEKSEEYLIRRGFYENPGRMILLNELVEFLKRNA